MAKPDLGTKVLCNHCGARFYDLNKKPPECPSCGSVVKVEKKFKARRDKAPVAETPAAKPKAAPASDELELDDDLDPDILDDDDEIDDDDDDDDLIEDTSDLGEDTDDVSEVLEHVEVLSEDKS
ncbi:MAG: FYDLN acid domain-containing protein [Rhodospirillales bacterium]|nr:FYDLN acid domain-containing protein [Rhodospirillales bacterium]